MKELVILSSPGIQIWDQSSKIQKFDSNLQNLFKLVEFHKSIHEIQYG